MTLQEIEKQVAGLPPEQLAAFADWFAEFKSEQWDRQIEADVMAGRLDHLVKEASDERNSGLTRPL